MQPTALAALIAVYLIWGSTYLAIRVSLQDLPPFLMAGTRFLIAGSALYLFLRMRGTPAPTARQWAGTLILGVLLLVLGHGGVVFAEQWVPSAQAALAVASMPIWATVFAALFGRRPGLIDILGILTGFAGVVLLNLDASLQAGGWGTLVLLLAPLSWAFGSVLGQRLPKPEGLMVSAAQMLMGGVVLSLISLGLHEPAPQRIHFWPLAAFLWQVVGGSIIAFSAYLYLLNNVRPALATSYAFVNPVIAVLLGVGLAGETVDAWGYTGMVVIVGAVAAITLNRSKT